MNILIAPDSFKDALAAPLVCEHLRRGLHRTFPAAHYQLLPLADGGEGTLLEADAVLANPNVLFATSILTEPLPLAEALCRTPALLETQGALLGRLLAHGGIGRKPDRSC